LHSLGLFEVSFRESFVSDNAFLRRINDYILQEDGKKLRPTVVLLAAQICGGCNCSSIEVAVALELLHTASLVHDDIVDETMQRRGRASINSLWNNKVAVLTGDFLMSQSLRHITHTGHIGIMQLVADIGIELSEGELLQLERANHSETTEEEYYTVIRKKTALLFASCARMGAMSVGANAERVAAMNIYGENLGLCFQIKDDIFDYSKSENLGKPTGNDIKEGKMTLPLIFALKNSSGAERNDIVNYLKNNDLTQENIAKIIQFVHQWGGVESAAAKMMEFKNAAIAALDVFPASPEKTALIACARFAVEREY